jgi:taurine dioxygenase
MPLSIKPLAGPLGAEVLGLDSSRPLEDEDFALLEQTLLQYTAIVVSDLAENVDWLLDLGRRFGPLVPHALTQYHHPATPEMSIISANMKSAESRTTALPAGAFWHSDLSYTARPSDAIFLYATHIPKDGGDTLMANMSLAYDALPTAIKARLEGYTAIHRYGYRGGAAVVPLTPEQQARYPDVEHPVIRAHPKTGRKTLFVNPGYTVRIVQLDDAASDDLLTALFAHALKPEFVYRHQWRVGQLVALDNRASMHCAVAGYREPRRMLRMIVNGGDAATIDH